MGEILDIALLAILGVTGLVIYERRCDIPGLATLAGCTEDDPVHKAGEATGEQLWEILGGTGGVHSDNVPTGEFAGDVFGASTGQTLSQFCGCPLNAKVPVCSGYNPAPVDILLGGLRSLTGRC